MNPVMYTDIQLWYPIWVFLEKEANDLDILQVCFEAISLRRKGRVILRFEH